MNEKRVFLFVLFCLIVSMFLPAFDFNFGIVKEVNWSVTITYEDRSERISYSKENGYTRPKKTTEIIVSAKTSAEAEKKAVGLWNAQKGLSHIFISANAIRIGT